MAAKGQLVRVTLYNMLSKVVVLLAAFVLNLYASRHLPQQQFGQAQFINWLTAFTWTLLNLGLPGTLARFVPQARNRGALRLLLRYSLVVLLCMLLLATIGIYLYKEVESTIQFRCLVLALLNILNFFLVSWLQGLLAFRSVFRAQLLAAMAALLLGWATIPTGGLDAYIRVLGVLFLSGIVLLLWPLVKHLRVQVTADKNTPAPFALGDLYHNTLYLAPSAVLAAMLWQRSEFYFVHHTMGYSEIALYSVALTLIALFTEPLRMFTGTLTPYFASMLARSEHPGQLFTRLYRYLWSLLVFAGAFLWVHADVLAGALYGDGYRASGTLIRCLLPGFIPGVCSYIVMSLHVAMGRARFLFTQDLLSAIVLVVLVRYVSAVAGMEGVAIAKAAAITFSVLLGLVYSVRSLKLRLPLGSMVVSLVMAILLALAGNMLHVAHLWQVGLLLLVSTPVYVLLLRFSGIISATEQSELLDRCLSLFRQQPEA